MENLFKSLRLVEVTSEYTIKETELFYYIKIERNIHIPKGSFKDINFNKKLKKIIPNSFQIGSTSIINGGYGCSNIVCYVNEGNLHILNQGNFSSHNDEYTTPTHLIVFKDF